MGFLSLLLSPLLLSSVVASATTITKRISTTSIILHLEEGLDMVHVQALVQALVQAVTELHKFAINVIIVSKLYNYNYKCTVL